MGILEGKRVLVTGGSRGIGAATVRTAMDEGAEVAFTFHRNSQAAEELARRMAERHPRQRCVALPADVADADEMRSVVAEITNELGRIDILVNNAGVVLDAAFGRMRRDQWDEVMATNLGSMFNVTQPLVVQLVKQRSGSIINLTSVAGVYGSANQTSYAASKAGIIGFTLALAKEVAPFGVRVNAVAPGFIKTDMLSGLEPEKLRDRTASIPAARLGTPEEVAHVICFLASDKASYINGQVVQVNGGLTL